VAKAKKGQKQLPAAKAKKEQEAPAAKKAKKTRFTKEEEEAINIYFSDYLLLEKRTPSSEECRIFVQNHA